MNNYTSYKNGFFIVGIKFPEEYPKKDQEPHFINPIYHINVNLKAKDIINSEEIWDISISFATGEIAKYKMRNVILTFFALF